MVKSRNSLKPFVAHHRRPVDGKIVLKQKRSVLQKRYGVGGIVFSDVIDVYLVDGERTEVGFHVIKSTWAYKGTLSEVLKDPAKFLSGELLPLHAV